MRVERVNNADPQVEALLEAHHALMRATSPEESCHVMTADALRQSGAQVFALRDDTKGVTAVGALKPFGTDSVELKSMHTAGALRGQGLGRMLLSALLETARQQGAKAAYLETGTADDFAAARALYQGAGFSECPPFGDYTLDPLSVFMHRAL
ncbi:GNAT family N-acetyltransferase [Thalassococcus lentus]|uniref:GNAT family N-acetyltransferase n=1 Tax=Thalassococcus lentus TaxID=1210524 RepID=A0ABT4XWG8_9RHOB|nr:GNAT family N-acetyltransferase [Thalassococcus lentus]MDA7426321.1 GNAT family N-acetyltransferase [Thalassococcus lentus]